MTYLAVGLAFVLGVVCGLAMIPWFGRKILSRLITQAIEQYVYSR